MSKQTRREFLENSMFATAAAVAAGTAKLPRLSAAEEKKPTSPNDVLRVACLGIRGRGQSHLEAYLKRSDCRIVAIVDPDEAVGQKNGVETVAKHQDGEKPAYHKDLRHVMDDKNIDIISIATPNHWHALAAIWAIKAGKDVYLEKPVSHNVSEGRRIVQAARKHKKIVQTGTQIRSSKGVRDAIEYMNAGKLGEVTLARGLCYKGRGSIGPRGNYEVPSSVDFDIWTGPAPMKPLTRPRLHYDWHWIWDTGNGDLGNQGIHQMDIARWGLGVDDIGRGVLSYGGRLGYEDAGETANTQVSVHDYGDKTLVFEVRGLKTEDLQGAKVGVIFYGHDGYLVINDYSGGTAFDPQGNLVQSFNAGGNHFGNFIDAVRSRKSEELHADVLEGHLSSALCHLGNVSYRLGSQVPAKEVQERLAANDETHGTFERVANHLAENGLDLANMKLQLGAQLTLDGKAEVFTGPMAATANPWLTREYRKPFVVPAESEV
ncbi:MAG: Gfo/Idh/MocA family oxidoreductase [Planctomycetaceae bacterium]